MNKVLKKWAPIVDALKVTDEDKRQKMADYAEHHSKLENIESITTVGNSQNLLPISMKVLSEMNNFNIINDPPDTIEYSITIKRYEIIAMETKGFDIMPQLESVLIKEIINDLKDKDISVYTMVDSIALITENELGGKMILRSRVKIN